MPGGLRRGNRRGERGLGRIVRPGDRRPLRGREIGLAGGLGGLNEGADLLGVLDQGE